MKTPFHMLIVGMTACGKTHYLFKMLEENFKGHFDYVFFRVSYVFGKQNLFGMEIFRR